MWLALLYALGHALVVVALGLAALYFQAVLPEWIDPVMERIVGATLVLLGAWVVFSLARYWRGGGELRLRSRWMLVFWLARQAWRSLRARLHGHAHDGRAHAHRPDQYGPGTAFGTGLIHGIGAETGTQVLIIAAVGGAASQGLGVAMLLAFVAGLVLSNTAVALLATVGAASAGRLRPVYLTAGCLAAVLSLYVGGYALLGLSDQLPDLPGLLGI
jgi:high-affinity nickel-transport protein